VLSLWEKSHQRGNLGKTRTKYSHNLGEGGELIRKKKKKCKKKVEKPPTGKKN